MFLTAETRNKIAGLLLAVAASLPAVAADLNVPTAVYPTIQAAVNAAQTNDTIHIASGVYTGQVVITNKILTLIGQPGTILRATTNLPSIQGYAGPQFPIMGIRSSQVTLRGLTFEGERLAERFVGPGGLQGIYFRQSSGIVENCAFYGFRESTPGPEDAVAIAFANLDDGPTEVDFRMVGSTFADNYNGIIVVGLPTRKSINATLENNTISGPGPLHTIDSISGIFIREGVDGRITGNTISGYSYVGTGPDFPVAIGIEVANEANYPAFGIVLPVIIEGNTLRDNQIHIALIKGDNSEVINNRFQGTAPGIIPVGLAATGTNVTIANNQFENMAEGIRLMGNDPKFGTLLGIAVNAQVTSNRFCGVTTNITVQPLASATQVGTLVCPFPPPTLVIAPAVLPSWPAIETGYVVECATNAAGPWVSLGIPPIVVGNEASVTVKAAGAAKFFRLQGL